MPAWLTPQVGSPTTWRAETGRLSSENRVGTVKGRCQHASNGCNRRSIILYADLTYVGSFYLWTGILSGTACVPGRQDNMSGWLDAGRWEDGTMDDWNFKSREVEDKNGQDVLGGGRWDGGTMDD